MPPFPGAQTTSVTLSLRFTAQASACSRPPEPKIKTFIFLPALSGLAKNLKVYLSKPGGGSQTLNENEQRRSSPILIRGSPHRQENRTVVEYRIKPYHQQVAEKERRVELLRLFRRNQALGLVMVAAAILVWWLLHTNPAWIFPPGWWRP
jgi:hypothetical protein